jgi:predicted metalloprotease with PDZ domain
VAGGLPASDAAAYRATQLENLRKIVDAAPPFLARMSTPELSREASFMYSDDFRTGRNIFARGALMAAEMDDRIVAETRGAKSLRDALRALVARTAATGAPFDAARFPELIQAATGVDVAAIFERWMRGRAK